MSNEVIFKNRKWYNIVMEVQKLLRKIKKAGLDVNELRIKKACDMAIKAHAMQKRASGEPYFHHPLEVAEILVEMKFDEATIITAILHDTVEDTQLTIEVIEQEFGSEVGSLVDGVTKLAQIKFQPDYIRQSENFRKLLLAMSEDIRVLLVKLADRLHNMRTLKYVSDEKKLRIAHETMEIYAPLSERIGIQKIKNELQDLSFSALHEEERESILSRLEFLRKDGGFVVDRIESHIKKTLSDMGIKAEVSGREKTPCSIWQKMRQKNISFEQLSDIIAFRVIVDDVIDCYQVLGIIHAAYHMVPESFKDYISTPKDNGYRSLHTVVVGPEKQRIEIQIRTHEMNEVNELGVAAHWTYKQGYKYSKDGKQYRWIRELLNILDTSNAEEFLEHTKLEMYEDQVFCFTPKGDITPLPRGSTPVDFAYALHSDIGHTCVGAKINGRIAPLRTKLENGDQVEIIRSKTQVPSLAWEKFVITGKARSEIKRFVRLQQRKEYINLGKSLILKYFKQEGFKITEIDIEEKLTSNLEIFQKNSLDDLYAALGEGTISRAEVAKIFIIEKKLPRLNLRNKFSFLKFRKKDKNLDSIPIKGSIPGMALNYASCCHPLPGDHITGIIHAGKGITIHTSDCDMLENFSATPERWIEVSWEKDIYDGKHIGRIKTTIMNEAGSLATISSVLAKNDSNITNLKVMSRSTDFFELLIDVEVIGVQHLTNIIASLRSKACVHTVERFRI